MFFQWAGQPKKIATSDVSVGVRFSFSGKITVRAKISRRGVSEKARCIPDV